MVLAEPVGRKRSFVADLLLTIVTFGVYAVYWNYRAHNEVYRQFELARESRDEGIAWLVLGLVVTPFLLAYFWVMASNVDYVRQRIGLPRGQTPGRFLLQMSLVLASVALAGVLLLLAPAAPAEGADPLPPEKEILADTLVASALALLLVGLVLAAVAYHGLQRDINELWDAYHARIAYLRANPEVPPPPAWMSTGGMPSGSFPTTTPYAPGPGYPPVPPGAPFDAQPRRYYADLPPPAPPVPPAPPTVPEVREELERLRQEHADLPPSGAVEDLLARAEAGDEEALRLARETVRERGAFAHERRRLLARRDQVLSAMESLEARLAQGEVDEPSYDAERTVLERDWRELTDLLEQVESRLGGQA